MENLMMEKTGGQKVDESKQESPSISLPPQNHHLTTKGNSWVSIQEINNSTGIPETTIRRYIQTFGDILPQGTKLGRAWKYLEEMVDTVKAIHALYQDGLSTLEIRERFYGDNLSVQPDDTTTFPPCNQTTLQEDIRELTGAIKRLTEIITTLSPPHRRQTTTPPQDHAQGISSTTTTPPQSHGSDQPYKKETPPATQEPGIPDCHGRELTTAETDAILIKVVELYPGRKNSQKRAEVMNKAGLRCGPDQIPWTGRKVQDNYRHALKRQTVR